MSGFLGGLFETKASIAASASRSAIPHATGSSLVRSFGGAGGSRALGSAGRWDIDQAMQYGVDQIMLVFRCVDVIAQNQAGLRMRLRRGLDRAEGEWLEDKRLNRLLNFRANTYESSMQFRYRLSANLLLSRRGAFVEIVRDKNGDPLELHILPAGSTSPIPDPARFVSGYEIRRGDNRVDILKPEDVMWLRLKPHPTDPYQQMTPLTSLGITIETDWLARQFNRHYLANGGRQGLLIGLKGHVSQEDAEEIKRRFSGGPLKAGEATVIESDGISISEMSGRPADTQWGDLLNTNKSEILLGFGVPESVMGNASGRTWDNADAERENFWNDTMVPHCISIAQSFDPLTGDDNDDVVIAYDFSTVDVLQRTARRDREEARAEFASGLLTVDEYRSRIGKDAWEVTGTKILMPNGLGIGPDQETQDDVKNIPAIAQPPAPEPGMEGSDPGNAYGPQGLGLRGGDEPADEQALVTRALADDLLTKAAKMRRANRGGARPKVTEVVHPYLSDAYLDEKTLEGILIGWDAQQEEIIADRLHHAKSRQGTRFWDYKDGQAPAEFKALDATYSVDPTRWLNDLRRSARRTLENVVSREAKRMAEQITGQRGAQGFTSMIPNDIDRAAILNHSYDDAWDMIERGASAQLDRSMKTIDQMAVDGASLKDIEREVRKSIGARSSWRQRTVQNAVHTAAEGVRSRIAERADMPLTKTWHAMHDDRVRESHAKADGQTRKASSRFRVGPAWMKHPRDPEAPLAQTINCRCFATYEVG